MRNQPQRRTDADDVDRLAARLDAQARQIERVRNTLRGVAREAGLSVSGPCDNCERCLLLVRDGRIFCPHCRNGQTL